jgi:hypothetical protein
VQALRPFAIGSRRRSIVPHAAVVALVALQTIGVRPIAAQAFTLPTVRVGEPPTEERMFFGYVRALRRLIAPDTTKLPTDSAARATALTRARYFGPKLDSLLLAAIDGDQPDSLVKARTRADTLRGLAGEKYDTIDVNVLLLDSALQRYVRRQRELGATGVVPAARVGRIEVPAIRERDARRLLRGTRQLDGLSAAQRDSIDTLTRLAVALIIFRKFDERDGLFPVHSHAQAEVFWGQRGFAPLNVGVVAASPAGGVAYTEIASPIVQFLRMSLGAVVAQNTDKNLAGLTGADLAKARDDVQKAALQQFLSGGGLVNLAAAWPAFHGPGEGRERALTLLLVPRLGFTAPKVGTLKDSTALALDNGVELHAKLLDLLSAAGLTGQIRWGYAVGSRGWGEPLGLARNRLTYATAGFGFAFTRQYQVTFSRMVAGPKSLRRPSWTIGLTTVRLPDP